MASNPGLFAAILVALCSIILSLATASAESLATADADAAADDLVKKHAAAIAALEQEHAARLAQAQ